MISYTADIICNCSTRGERHPLPTTQPMKPSVFWVACCTVRPPSAVPASACPQAKGEKGEKANKSSRQLNAEELVILQRFYEQLCVVVEQQKMSDPTCLMIVHKVKSLMEQGVFLHKPLLVQVGISILECFAYYYWFYVIGLVQVGISSEQCVLVFLY